MSPRSRAGEERIYPSSPFAEGLPINSPNDDTTNPLVSVIVLNWNGEKWIRKLFESIFRSSYSNIEVILADNNSSDSSLEICGEFPHVRQVRFEKNHGYARANNLAAHLAKGEFLFFLNNDTWIEIDTIKRLVATLIGNHELLAAAPDVREYWSDARVNNGVSIDIFGYPVLPEPAISGRGTFLYADGCGLFCRASHFNCIGGFDPSYFMYGEDLELGWKGMLLGHFTVPSPNAIVHHLGGGSSDQWGKSHTEKAKDRYKLNLQKRRLAERNTLLNILKFYSAHWLALILPIYFLLNVCEAILLSIRNKRFTPLRIYAGAWHEALKMLSDELPLRKAIQTKRVIGEVQVLRSLVWKYSKFSTAMRRGVPIV